MGIRDSILKMRAGFRLAKAIMTTTFRKANTDLDIWSLQQKYAAMKGKVLEVHMPDVGYTAWFKVQDGQLHMLDEPRTVHGRAVLSLTTMLDLVRGSIEVIDPATGASKTVTYDPFTAWRYGDLQVYGEAATNDVYMLVKQVYAELYPKIRSDLIGLTV